MSHYGERLTALVDGQLGAADRDRLLVHVAGCPACRAEVDAQRRVKSSVGALPAPAPSDPLLHRLVSLAAPGEPRRPGRSLSDRSVAPPPPGRPTRAARPGVARRDRHRPAPQRSSRVRTLAVGAVSVAVITLGTAFVAGGGEGQGAPLAPPVDTFPIEHARTSVGVAVVDAAAGAVSASFGGEISRSGTVIAGVPGR
jgi:anti-sigma factor RsiW